MTIIAHKWRWVKDEPNLHGLWRLYVCDECGSTCQVEYCLSSAPCAEYEEASPRTGTAA